MPNPIDTKIISKLAEILNKSNLTELEYEDELLKFPGGLHDDQVDCTSQALNDLMSKQEHIDPSNVEAILRGFYG